MRKTLKNKELVEILNTMNPEAEVGYECQTIVRAHADITGDYIDLSGEDHIEPENIGNTGVFIVVSEYIKMVGNSEDGSVGTINGTEITAVYKTRKAAEKMGEWLIKMGEYDGMKYINYKIENFLILNK